MHNKIWTQEEYCYLRDNWGKLTIPQLSQNLQRSQNAIKCKIHRLKLGRCNARVNCLSARQVASLLNIDANTVIKYWIKKYELKGKLKAPYGKERQWFIDFDILVDWLKHNQSLWDSRKLPLYALGPEYDWLIEKRKLDLKRPKRGDQRWTRMEEIRLVRLFKLNYTYKEISEILSRTENSVKTKLRRMFRTKSEVKDDTERIFKPVSSYRGI